MISFRHIIMEDFERIKLYVTNTLVSKYLTWEAYGDDEEIEKFLQKTIQCNNYPNEYLAILYNNIFIGTLHLIERTDGNVQYGFGILPEFWGKGLGNSIVKESLSYLGASQWSEHVKEIWADTHHQNNFAINVLEHNGFTYKGYIDEERKRYSLIWKKQVS